MARIHGSRLHDQHRIYSVSNRSIVIHRFSLGVRRQRFCGPNRSSLLLLFQVGRNCPSLFTSDPVPFNVEVGSSVFVLSRRSFSDSKPHREARSGSTQDYEFSCLNKISCEYPIEVHPARETAGVEAHIVTPRVLYCVDQSCDLLAEGGED